MSTGEPAQKRERNFGSLIQQVQDGSKPFSEVQKLLTKVAPEPDMTFHRLRATDGVVFRDVTKALSVLGVSAVGNRVPDGAARAFLRGRRWGKSVLGDMWLEFLRGRADLFRGTWAQDHMRPEGLIGVKLDISQCKTYGTFVELLVEQINEGLELAEQVAGYAVAAKGKRVVIPSRDEPSGVPNSWSSSDCTAIIPKLLFQLRSISKLAGHSVALFVDEYDSMAIRALQRESKLDYKEVSVFFADFYTTLKAQSATVPFLFITGSSRLAMKGFWSGANTVSDISLDKGAATMLGYTWEEIEGLYDEHLQLLQAKLSVDRQALKAKIEQWYNKHRWTPESTAEVFNPHSIHQLMIHGEFKPYWATSGESSFLMSSGQFLASVVRAAAGKKVHVSYGCLQNPRVQLEGHVGRSEFTSEAQLCLLVGAGVLAVAHEYKAPEEWPSNLQVNLSVPNRDARTMLLGVLSQARPAPQAFTEEFLLSYLHSDNMAGLFRSDVMLHALRDGLRFFNGVSVPSDAVEDELDATARACEFRLSLALSANLFSASLQTLGYRAEEPCPRIDDEQLAGQHADVQGGCAPRALTAQPPLPGQPPRADHVFDCGHVVHVAEFKVLRGRGLRALLSGALVQCLKYQLVKVQEGAERRFSAHAFGDEGDQAGVLLAGTKSLNLADAHRCIAQLNCKEVVSVDVMLAEGVVLD